LYNAVGATMQAYNADRSVANLRNMDAAKDAFDKFVAEIGGNVNKDRFDNLHAVLSFLQDSGWKIKKTNLYQHRKDGKLIPDSDGTFARAAVEKYARTFLKQTATGKRVTEATDDLQRKILTQQTQINDLKIKQQERRNAIEEKKFVSVQIVLDAAFTMFRHTRDAMMNIPDRIAEIVAAETDPVKVREILTTELRQSLERLEKPEVLIEH
jgi:hypothetical protein